MALTRAEGRTAGLLFADELAEGLVGLPDLGGPGVEEAVRARRVPSGLGRLLQRRAVARGALGVEQLGAAPAAAREAVLGPRAAGPPRVLLGVGEVDAGDHTAVERLAALHGALAAAGLRALAGVRLPAGLPAPRTAALLASLADDGLELGLALKPRATGLAEDLEVLGAVRGSPVAVAVTMPGRLRARDWPGVAAQVGALAGPPDVETFGALASPSFRGQAVWALAASDVAGPPDAVAVPVRRLADRRWALWTPVWAPGDPAALAALARELREGGMARSWPDLLAAAQVARALGPAS